MHTIASTTDDAMGSSSGAGERVASLWREYEEGVSPEAVFLKDLDKLEMILQAHEYEMEHDRYDLHAFFESTQDKFKTPVGIAWADQIRSLRTARHALHHHPPTSPPLPTTSEDAVSGHVPENRDDAP